MRKVYPLAGAAGGDGTGDIGNKGCKVNGIGISKGNGAKQCEI